MVTYEPNILHKKTFDKSGCRNQQKETSSSKIDVCFFLFFWGGEGGVFFKKNGEKNRSIPKHPKKHPKHRKSHRYVEASLSATFQEAFLRRYHFVDPNTEVWAGGGLGFC